jgi:predicted nucleic acid-binding protein
MRHVSTGVKSVERYIIRQIAAVFERQDAILFSKDNTNRYFERCKVVRD